jgi:integrase
MSKDKILIDYKNFKSLTIKVERKIKDNLKDISDFVYFFKISLDKIKESDLIKYCNSTTTQSYKHNLKNFIKWYYPDWSAKFPNLKTILKVKKGVPKYTSDDMLSKEDIQKIIQFETLINWKVFWLLLFYGGCRPVEVRRLKWENITFDDEGAFLKIYSGKNNRFFTKFVPEDVAFYLRKFKEQSNSEWVFPSSKKEGDHIGRNSDYLRLRKITPLALGRKINPYILRHSVATILYNDDSKKEENVAQQMGHEKSMRKNYTHLNSKQLKENAKKMWIAPNELPPEKKAELEKELNQLKEKLETLSDYKIQFLKERKFMHKAINEIFKKHPVFIEATNQTYDKIKKY